MNLRALQKAFVEAIHDPEKQTSFANEVNSTHQLTAEQRIAVYRDSILSNRTNVLSDIYPVCEKLVGKQFFSAMVAYYIQQTPSYSPDLNTYGESLGEFIDKFEPTASLPYLGDVARLEWCWHYSFNAPYHQNHLDYNQLSLIEEDQMERIIFILLPSIRLLTSIFPVSKIWQVNQKDYCGDPSINLEQEKKSEYLLIWRPDKQVLIEHISEKHWQVLRLIADGFNLKKICEYLECENQEINISQIFRKLTQRGYFVNFMLENKREKSCGI